MEAPMADTNTVVPIPRIDDAEKKWSERERTLLDSIDASIRYYTRCARTARIWHRIVGVVILICVVISPVAVVSTGTGAAGAGLSAFSIPTTAITAIAVASTIIVALAEGLRRTFQFEHRWITCVKAREDLWRLKDTYLDEQVPNPVGTGDWIARFSDLRKREQEVRIQEEGGFFESLKAARDKVPTPH
jgi:Protein of unknown function (DUF4231)